MNSRTPIGVTSGVAAGAPAAPAALSALSAISAISAISPIGAVNAVAALTALVLIALPGPAQAHGNESHPAKPRPFDASKVEDTAFGRQGDPAKATRTIRVGMADTMRFTPAAITVRRGETVRLVATNKGRVLHEMVLGTAEELKKHAEQMKKFPDMEHDEPHMAHVKPGRRGEIVWQFTQPGEFQFACLIPGHFEAGMVGKVTVK